MKPLIIALILFLNGTTVFAGSTLGEFVDDAPKNEQYLDWIYFSGQAMMFSSITAERKTGTPIYCPPPKLSITPDQYLLILSKSVGDLKARDRDVSTFGLFLLEGLQKTFPCGGG
ncbi:hypothetical protein [Rhizobium leguminosarum]|uniref:hypothetical protein n=1 Tax=Rhizobium leguminosarum TaxID=384 RepID=UPI000B92CF92|nr:hypothetical protein [Rhizobium leguminosarum]ASS53681.1 hypothetical protein CHR56_03290 [Rhizobium leguminosarum bv. viciae]